MIPPVSVTAAPPTKGDSALSQLSQDTDQFMKLLIAQVRNQDPLSPMEGTEFMAQLAQLTQVEQAIQTNQNIESLSATLSMNAALSQTSLIGREVTTISETVALNDFGGAFSYELESSPASVSAIITDAAGNLVKQIDGLPTESGKVIDVAWDGTNANGDLMPSGQYKISLATPGGDGSYNTYASATVESVEFSGGIPVLRLSDGRYSATTDIVRAM